MKKEIDYKLHYYLSIINGVPKVHFYELKEDNLKLKENEDKRFGCVNLRIEDGKLKFLGED